MEKYQNHTILYRKHQVKECLKKTLKKFFGNGCIMGNYVLI